MEMAAAVGLASAITALIGNVVTVVQYVDDFKSAIKELRKWREDLQGLRKLLEQLEKHAQQAAAHPDDPWYQAFLKAVQEGGTLMDGKYNVDGSFRSGGILLRLEERVGKLLEMLQPQHGLPKLWKRLTYTINKGDIAALFCQINELKSQLESFIQLDLFNLSVNIQSNQKAQFKAIQATLQNQEQRTEKNEEEGIIKWLSPLEFLKKQKETYDQSFPTGKWLLESVEFTAWMQGRAWPLHCYGAPGAGKVIIPLNLRNPRDQIDNSEDSTFIHPHQLHPRSLLAASKLPDHGSAVSVPRPYRDQSSDCSKSTRQSSEAVAPISSRPKTSARTCEGPSSKV